MPVSSSAPENAPAAPDRWWVSLQQEQLAAYIQQQRELFAQAAQVTERLVVCTSQEEHDQLMQVMQHLTQKEKELRYMLETRQAWDAYTRVFEMRLEYLASRAQAHP